MMLRLLLPILLFFSGVQLLRAQVNCDTVSVIAQADDAFLTCVTPTAVLEAFQAPGLTDYHWSGPNGFSADTFRIVQNMPGAYTLTVTGKYGCTAQTTAHLIDLCDFIALVPPECSNPVYQASDDCADICVSPGLSQLDSTHNYTAGNPPAIFCDGVENDQWWGFVAGASAGTISIKADTCENGDGIQVGLYDGCQTAPLFCNPGFPGGEDSTIHLQVSGLIPGKVYFLMIDGYDGDKCKFRIGDPDGVCTGGPGGGGGIVNGPTKVCPGATVTYTLSGAGINTAFYWTAPPGATINGQSSPALLYTPAGGSVTIAFGNSGGSVCVRTVNYFEPPGAPVCLYVTMMPIPPTTLPQEIVCAENTPYVWEPDPSQILVAPGTYNLQTTLQSYLGCDSVVHQRVIVRPPIQTTIGAIVRCKGQCFTINGSDYCSPGIFTEVLNSYQGCDSIVTFNLIILDPQAIINSSGELNCENNTVTLSAGGSAGTRQWRDPAGQVIGTGTSITVSQPGIYTLTVTVIQSGVSCSKTASMNVPFNATPVTASAVTNGFISCQQPIIQINGSASVPGSSFEWSGPGGFTANTPTISVGTPGVYILIVTAPSLCTDTTAVVVTENTKPPGAAAQGGSLTCDLSTVILQGSSGTANPVIYDWSGPGGFTSNLQTPEVNSGGLYQVTVTDLTNGCTSMAQASVALDTIAPIILLNDQHTVNCIAPTATLAPVITPPAAQIIWSGPNGFNATDSLVVVSEPGLYTLKAIGSNGCESLLSTMVIADQELPNLSLYADTLNCLQTSVQIEENGGNGLLFTWTGPNGFISTEQEPWVSDAGNYQLLVENPANGCTDTYEVVVPGAFEAPEISATSGILTCAEPEIELIAASNTPDVQIQWSGNGQSTSGPTLAVTTPGTYTATATAPNGCTSSISVEVISTITVPNVNVLQIPPGCGDTLLHLDASSNTPDVTFTWIGPGGIPLDSTEDLTVAEPGWYRVKVTTPDGCSNQIQILAVPAPAFPVLSISGDTISCAYPTGNLNISSNMAGTVIETIVDPQTGLIQILATAPNGCTVVETVQMVSDVNPPDLLAEGATLTCAAPVATLSASSGTPGTTFVWSGNGFQTQGPTLEVDSAGVYTAVATAPNGCTSTVTVEVVDSCTTSIPGEVSVRKLNIRVFPNPSSGQITVESTDGAPMEALQVWNTQGKQITHQQLDTPQIRTSIDLPGIPAGVYYLNVLIQGVWYRQLFTVVR